MRSQLRPALVALGMFTILTGLVYPLVVTGIAQVIFPGKANGSLIVRNGQPVGSALIGQPFDDPKYFWGRLSATSPAGYTAACAAVRDMDQRSSVAGVRVPTLVIAGRDDVATPPAASRWLAIQIPGARLVELPAAHLSNIEAEGLFNERVFEFLSAEEPSHG